MRVSTSAFFRTQIVNMQLKYQNISRLQNQLLTGNKIQRPSEDPINASKIQSMDLFLRELETYNENIIAAKNRNDLFEKTTQNLVDVTLRTSELITNGANGTLNNTDRANIAKEMEARLTELLQLANTQDPRGEYIFSGTSSTIVPYKKVGGNHLYFGDQNVREFEIAQNKRIIYAENGYRVFGDIKTGNGTFTASADIATNTGTGVISPGSVTDINSYVADDYTITFVTNGSGNLAYQVFGASSGQVIPLLPLVVPTDAPDYVEGESIVFNGISTQITGTPAVGDTFQIKPSKRDNIFNTVQNIINALKTPVNNETEQAVLQNLLNQHAASFDRANEHLLNYLSEVGTRGTILENEDEFNQSIRFDNEISLSLIRDVDYTETVSKLNQEMLALELAQQSYLQIQGLNLFQLLYS